jgi:hypothetical protein
MAHTAFCDVCLVNLATVKDRRKLAVANPPQGMGREFLVCRKCAKLSNFWFARILQAQDKEKALNEYLEGNWTEWVIKKP